ncbi:MAG: HAD hydrolase-like protein [Chromatiaceae bacterium]|jgi:HAD superfamily hydrolase (TIGR01450 family)|nr:HAD hydrolase-like protein [Chromatiaceae bacterium]
MLVDAYGVLVDKSGALPGAADFIRLLESTAKPYLVLTNSASRLPETLAAEIAEAGVPIPSGRVLTSGALLADHFRDQGLAGARCLVLGPADSVEYVRRAGGEPVPARPDADADVVVLADQKGFPCLPTMNLTLGLVLRRLDAGRPLHLILCNPDLIYPVAPGHYGFTAGGLAAMLEAVIKERYPDRPPPLVRLGKPHAPIFDAARRRIAGRLVMLGDQLATDILGANRNGIDSILIGTGLARGPTDGPIRPTWYLPSLVDEGFAANERQ